MKINYKKKNNIQLKTTNLYIQYIFKIEVLLYMLLIIIIMKEELHKTLTQIHTHTEHTHTRK